MVLRDLNNDSTLLKKKTWPLMGKSSLFYATIA